MAGNKLERTGANVFPNDIESASAIEGNPAEWAVKVAEKLSPSMVVIKVYGESKDVTDPDDPSKKQPPHSPEAGSGSGFIVSADGWIVTNRHVGYKPGMKFTAAVWTDGKLVEKKVLSYYVDPLRDIAIMKMEGSGYTPVSISYKKIPMGLRVAALGSPLGKNRFITSGLATPPESELPDELLGVDDDDARKLYSGHISTSAVIHHGNSGGGLVDAEGDVRGVNTLLEFGHGTGAIGHAIPMAELKALIENVNSFILIQALCDEIMNERKPEDETTGVKKLSLDKAVDKFLTETEKIVASYVPAEMRKRALNDVLSDRSIQYMYLKIIKNAHGRREEYENRYITLATGEAPQKTVKEVTAETKNTA